MNTYVQVRKQTDSSGNPIDPSASPAQVSIGPVRADAAPPDGVDLLEWIDVTNANPQPEAGWTYDGTNFVKPTTMVNHDALMGKGAAALNANVTFLGLASPTNAQTLAQVQSLTKQVTALIRLVMNQLDSTAGT